MSHDDVEGPSTAPKRTDPAPRPAGAAAGPRARALDHLAHALGAKDDLPIDPDLAQGDLAAPSVAHRRRAGTPATGRAQPAVLAAIFAGGFLGTLARYAVEDAWTSPASHFPTATFVINTSGAFALGLLLTVLLERLRWHSRLARPFAVTGVLGGWTTYSTFVVESVTLGHDGRLAMAAGYVALTLLCGVAGVALGIALGRSRRLDGVGGVVADRWLRVAGSDKEDSTLPAAEPEGLGR